MIWRHECMWSALWEVQISSCNFRFWTGTDLDIVNLLQRVCWWYIPSTSSQCIFEINRNKSFTKGTLCIEIGRNISAPKKVVSAGCVCHTRVLRVFRMLRSFSVINNRSGRWWSVARQKTKMWYVNYCSRDVIQNQFIIFLYSQKP